MLNSGVHRNEFVLGIVIFCLCVTIVGRNRDDDLPPTGASHVVDNLSVGIHVGAE